MKITLEFDNIEKFFQELPRFAALMNLSGQFATFEHIKKSDMVSKLGEPRLPDCRKEEDYTAFTGTQEQLDNMKPAQDIVDATNKMLDQRKEKAKTEKVAKKTAEKAQEAQEPPKEEQADNSTPEAEKPAQKPTANASGAVKDTDVRKMLNKLIKGGHREEVKTILSQFGAENFSGLDEKDYAAVVEKAKEVLGDD